MKGLKELLLKEENRLENIIESVNERAKKAPEGRLRLSKSHNHVQYYFCDGEKKSGIYIPKENSQLAQQLAQKSYDEKIFKLSQKRLAQIKKITRDYMDDEIEFIYLTENEERQKLVKPVEPTWEQKSKEWLEKSYAGKGFHDGTPTILTENGERVRSKSEKIMADFFLHHGIPYKYECPLYLKGFGTIYPDFTFLSKQTGEEIYWEHNGKVDDNVYARNMVKKIDAYEENGIFVGERLILTYETEQTILNTKKIEQMAKKYLM